MYLGRYLDWFFQNKVDICTLEKLEENFFLKCINVSVYSTKTQYLT